MADKKTSHDRVADKLKAAKNKLEIVKELNKFIGDDEEAIKLGAFDRVKTVSTGIPALDEALKAPDQDEGGFPIGRIIEIFGGEAGGKTWVVLKHLSYLQEHMDEVYPGEGRFCAFLDVENALDPYWAQKNGVDMENIVYKNTFKHAEEVFELSELLCESGRCALVVIDSTAALVPKSSLEAEEYGGGRLAALAATISTNIRRLNKAAARNKTTIIFINQIRETPGVMFGNSETTPGGRSLKFFSSVRVSARKVMVKKDEHPDFYELDKNGRNVPIGHRLVMKVEKSKHCPPFRTAEATLRYKPQNRFVQAIVGAIEKGIIEVSKSNHKRVTYRGELAILPRKEDWESFIEFLKAKKLMFPLLEDMGCVSKDVLNQMVEEELFELQEVKDYLSGDKNENSKTKEKNKKGSNPDKDVTNTRGKKVKESVIK